MNASKMLLVILGMVMGCAISEGIHRARDGSQRGSASPPAAAPDARGVSVRSPSQRTYMLPTMPSAGGGFIDALAIYDEWVEECWRKARNDLLAKRPRFTVQTAAGAVEFGVALEEKDAVDFHYLVRGAVVGSLLFHLENGTFSNVRFRPVIVGTSAVGPNYMVLELPAE